MLEIFVDGARFGGGFNLKVIDIIADYNIDFNINQINNTDTRYAVLLTTGLNHVYSPLHTSYPEA